MDCGSAELRRSSALDDAKPHASHSRDLPGLIANPKGREAEMQLPRLISAGVGRCV